MGAIRPYTVAFGAVLRCCKRWGVEVHFEWPAREWPARVVHERHPVFWKLIPSPPPAPLHVGPSGHTALDHDAGVIYLNPGYPWGEDESDPIDLAHELAHCLTSDPPNNIDEGYSSLFAMEYAIGRLRYAAGP